MADETNIKAIEIQGIVRNQTKIGVKDGQADDLINLRFIDGSWRTSGDGTQVYRDTTKYEQVYVHTNVYRHLLGVKEGELFWFANIDADGVFTALGEAIKITNTTGEIWISQTGHLITIIDQADNFEHFVFHTEENLYYKVEVDENGTQTQRGLYPFGQVHFNLYSPIDEEHTFTDTRDTGWNTQIEVAHSMMLELFDKATQANKFTRPLLALVACKLYDGTYAFASEPVLLCPRELSTLGAGLNEQWDIDTSGNETLISRSQNLDTTKQDYTIYAPAVPIAKKDKFTLIHNDDDIFYEQLHKYKSAKCTIEKGSGTNLMTASPNSQPTFENGYGYLGMGSTVRMPSEYISKVHSSDIILSLSNFDFIKTNNHIIKGLTIFITKQADIYDMSAESYKDSPFYDKDRPTNTITPCTGTEIITMNNLEGNLEERTYTPTAYCYFPKQKTNEEIIYELLHSPFYLLREYTAADINELESEPIIKLTDPQYKEVLSNSNITQQPTLNLEATARLTYLPKYTMMYNGRLHIANYKTQQFHGYPIDLFQLNNHSLKYEQGSSFHTLDNLTDNYDNCLQYQRQQYQYVTNVDDSFIQKAKEYNHAFAQVIVDIETDNGTQKVVRYVSPNNYNNEGIGNFFEDLPPLLTFPDVRAKRMEIRLMYLSAGNIVTSLYAEFQLKPHPLYNFAFYIDDELKPIRINDPHYFQPFGQTTISEYINQNPFQSAEVTSEQNTEEYFPNGLKVSATDNPLIFPVEHTYQVGSAEIVALATNAIAVGTGQTGQAPLYVFCKDGIYAMFVDSTGEMAYTNSRIIARDVCNNMRSVTPTDDGVVFTTDRGLMIIAGEKVEEIGQVVEGDILGYGSYGEIEHPTPHIVKSNDYIGFARGALEKVAQLPKQDDIDFLTYIKNAIIGYNHNLRELIVSSPTEAYQYIRDRNGNWRRNIPKVKAPIVQFVSNYPTLYAIYDQSSFTAKRYLQLDREQNNLNNEADNQFFYLSNIVKLDSIGFKQATRFVVRGFFSTKEKKYLGCYILGSYDGRKFALLGGNERTGTFTDIGCKIERTDVKFLRICLAGQLKGNSRIDYMEISYQPSVLNTKIR